MSEKLETIRGDARLISASDNVLYPMIKLRIENRLNLACTDFTSGKLENLVGHIAYIKGMKDIEAELRQLQRKSNDNDRDLLK